MRRILALLLLLPLAHASPGGHEEDPFEVVMHVHFAGEDQLPMQPMAPTAFVLPPAPEAAAPECGSALEWAAVFTQVPVDGDVVWTSGLAREADLGPAKPSLRWFIEMVQPGSDEPVPVEPPALRLQAELRAGETVGSGRLLAQATVEDRPAAESVEGRFVHRFDARLDWQNQTILQDEGFHLVVRLDAGPEQCRIAPAGVRAYADETHLPRLVFDVYEPVRIDLLEPRMTGDGWQIIWHASSPWGRFDLQQPEAPRVRGPGGEAPLPSLAAISDASVLEMTWDWDPGAAPNGTYRIDATIRNAAGEEATAKALFQVGADPATPQAPPQEPGKKSPAPFLLPLLAILVLRRVSR